MAAPRQMTAETLNALKGWPRPAAVDFEAKFDSSITERVPAGTVVHVDPANAVPTYKLGVGTLNVMPLFTFQASDDPDVENDGGDAATEKGIWIAISPTGVVMALVAIGAYELVSTNFLDSESYLPNKLLTADVGTDPTTGDAGQLKGGTLGTHNICGVCSRGDTDNGYGSDAVAFWPVFLPVYP
jgi:hypothetical protein